MKRLKWLYSLLLLPVAFWLSAGNAQAALVVNCTAGLNIPAGSTGSVIISDAVTPANADSVSITATLNYSCTNSSDTAGFVSVCLGVDGGDYNPTIVFPRYMKNGFNTSRLAFTMTLPGGRLWGIRTSSGSEYNSGSLSIAANASISGNVPIVISLLPNNDNTLATAGTYTNNFNSNHTVLTSTASIDGSTSDCTTGGLGANNFPFTVQATVIPSCKITATSDVSLGSHSASATNITGSNNNAISVTCTNSISYNIGLTPSNGNVNGAGIMTGTAGNLDKVPYQLQSNANGAIWGNNGSTYDALNNGFIGEGNGADQTKTVYVTAPSADFTPDSYSDTVTVHVNY